ncbi:MAG: hypothetical protein HY904_12670 [Deltaproteobacteria bacterium]|nr:hypothetical protein [Deltaproteobacteria bacterium]
MTAERAGEGFAFAVCQVGAEAALKAEVAAARRGWKAAFQRPGLVTFKVDERVDGDTRVPAVLARHSGAGLGPAADARGVVERAASLPTGGEWVLHVFARDRYRPGEEPDGYDHRAAAAEVERAVRAAWPATGPAALAPTTEPALGQRVLDVVVAPGEPHFVGFHVHALDRPRWPGGRVPVDVPPEAPSRAYGKLEEGMGWSGAPVRAGDVAVELGSAPGGATYALLRRGVHVHGVDPGEMSPVVTGYVGPGGARLVHHRVRMGDLQRTALPEVLHWVVLDVNAAPQVALTSVARFCAAPRGALLGVLLTLKLDDWKAVRHLPRLADRIRKLGMEHVAVTQLAGNRTEVFAYGLTAAGLARKRGFPSTGGRATGFRR